MRFRKQQVKNLLLLLLVVATVLVLGVVFRGRSTFAESESDNLSDSSEETTKDISETDTEHYVNIYDGSSHITVRSNATTVREVLERAEVEYTDRDNIEPGLDEVIDSRDYNINIYRARSVLVIDGDNKYYADTAKMVPSDVAEAAGIELKDASYFMNVPGSAIDSKGYLYMEGGNGRIESKNSHAIVADKDLFIDGGSFYLRAPKGDGIRSRGSSVLINDGAYSMDAGTTNMCQGIRAETIMDIRGGYINVNSGYRGFLAQKITTSGGTTSVTTLDDGWKADTLNRSRLETLVDISGGNHFINAGGDGIDSESRLEMRRGLMIIASTEDEAHSPLESGENNPILVSGGTLIAYGSSGQVFSLNGTQNTVVVKKHNSLEANKYYVVRAGSNYYAVKTTKESSSISVSSSDFASNDYAIMTASSIVYDTPIWESAGFYRIRSFTFLSLICSGTYSSSANQHPEYYENPWNVPSGWRHFGF